MQKFLITATALVGLCAQVSPTRAADPVIDAGYDWTGAYVGLVAGIAFNDSSIEDQLTGDFLTDPNAAAYQATYPQKFNDKSDGFTGGVTAGYNHQSGNIVFGLEADLNYLDVGDSTFVDGFIDTSLETDIDWFATIRPRVGYAVDNLLLYVTGGLALGDVESSIDVLTPPTVYHWSGSSSGINVGWTIGAGAEWAITDSLSVKGEYMWVDLGSDKYALNNDPANPIQGFTMNGKADYQFSVARIGLNFQF